MRNLNSLGLKKPQGPIQGTLTEQDRAYFKLERDLPVQFSSPFYGRIGTNVNVFHNMYRDVKKGCSNV